MSNLYPPSEKRLAELRQRDIFPRSPILESTFALAGAAAGIWVCGPLVIENIKKLSVAAFDLSNHTGVIDGVLVRNGLLSVVIVLLMGAAARLIVIKAESRIMLRYPAIDFGRIFRIGENISQFWSNATRGFLLAGLVFLLGAFMLTGVLPYLVEYIVDWQRWSYVPLLASLVVMVLLGVLELFRSVVTFGSRYGMTRDELIAEQQELRPEFKSEIQKRFNDGD